MNFKYKHNQILTESSPSAYANLNKKIFSCISTKYFILTGVLQNYETISVEQHKIIEKGLKK